MDLSVLDGDALLGRHSDPQVDALLEQLAQANRLLLATPVYRAAYTGLLKVLLDQLPLGAFEGCACVLAATGGSPIHYLSLDTSMRALVASLGGWSVPTVVYATGNDFNAAGQPSKETRNRLSAALSESRRVTGE